MLESGQGTADVQLIGAESQPEPRREPRVDLRLARLHLRTGVHGLARAELESLVGWGELDEESLIDLAEARWRTGDLEGAGDAARAFLATGREAVLGLVIAAEAIAAAGRPGEARRLAGQALERAGDSLDGLFAGMPRSGIWPHDPSDPGEHVGPLLGESAGAAASGRAAETAASAETATAVSSGDDDLGLWEGHPQDLRPLPVPPDAAAELEAARDLLTAGDIDRAAVRLAVVLRVSPILAPAVLDVLPPDAGPALELVRGDAFRLLGHDGDAQRAYASALAGVTADMSARESVAPESSYQRPEDGPPEEGGDPPNHPSDSPE